MILLVFRIRSIDNAGVGGSIAVLLGFFLLLPVTSWAAAPKAAKKITPEPSVAAVAEAEATEQPALPFLTVMLARDPAVQAELRLKPPQVEQLESAVKEVDGPLWLLRDVPIKTCGDKLDALLSQFRQQLKQSLTAAQLDRFKQIVFQARGSKGLVAPETITRLSLSAEQTDKFKKVVAETSRELDAIQGQAALSAAERGAAGAKSRKAETKRIVDLLSSPQQTALTALVGKPFDFSQIQRIGGFAPELQNVEAWINSEPLVLEKLRGKVVVVHFWAFGCINCVHNLPHYQSWHEKFRPSDVTIIGIQTPETESERNLDNLRRNVKERGIVYPVAFDAASKNWQAWANNMWPSVYLIDKRGQVRSWWYGELNWQGGHGEEQMRKKIEELVAEK